VHLQAVTGKEDVEYVLDLAKVIPTLIMLRLDMPNLSSCDIEFGHFSEKSITGR